MGACARLIDPRPDLGKNAVSPRKGSAVWMCDANCFVASFNAERARTFVSGEQQRRALAERGVTVVANITKDRALVEWAQDTGRDVYIARNYRGWRDVGWGNHYRAQIHTPEEHDRVIALYVRSLDENPMLLGRLAELCGGKVLLCWCHPLPCHGDVLAKRANALRPSSG